MNRRSFLALAPAVLLADELPSPRRVYSFGKPVTLDSTIAMMKRLYNADVVGRAIDTQRSIISAVDNERGIITVTTDWLPPPKAKGWVLHRDARGRPLKLV